MDTNKERDVAGAVEWQLLELLSSAPKLAELPIAPLHGLNDLARLELALRQFADIHRSRQSKSLIRKVQAILCAARARLRADAPVSHSSGMSAQQVSYPDTQPAAEDSQLAT